MHKPTAGQLAQLLAALTIMTCLSQFYRVSNGVIAPELMRELGLSPQQLGVAGGAFFFTLLAAQIPVGIWFDRFGARITLSVLSVFAVIGSVMLARATSANELIIARAIIGLGCAANFMALVVVLSRWVEPARYTTVLSWGFALSNIGTIVAATPLAWAAATIGWRTTFLVLGMFAAIGALINYAVVRDRPPGTEAPLVESQSMRDVMVGLLTVWRTPGLMPVLAMHTFAYATQLTVLGIWAGPYLFDVFHLDGIARGNVLLLMGVVQIIGVFCYGPLDHLVGSRKRVVIAGAVLTIATLTMLAAIERPPVGLAVGLLVLVTLAASYGVVIVSQGRALFPAHQAGRGATTVNMAQLIGLVLLPIMMGAIIGSFQPSGGFVPEIAYRTAFAALAFCNVCGLLLYLRSTDSRP